MILEEQEAAEELRQKLALVESAKFELGQLSESLLRENDRHKAFETDVSEFLQKLGQIYPGIAQELVSPRAGSPAPHGVGGG
mmetsp:Transcript_32332/g.66661  ORF Transcript_32332/g.66661 Transcript_32332/m.66661 type:complete len:82 (+) Transcript_32332:511-756(+)